MTNVVIVSAVRTPIGRIRGALSDIRPDDMAALVIKAAVERTGIDAALIEEVYMGCANQAGEDNRNVARMGGLLAGLPQSVAGVTVNRLCASGLNAINMAARAIKAGEGDVFVAGGVESMSRAPYSIQKNPIAFGPSGNVTAWDTALGWRYPNPVMEAMFPFEQMGETAENVYEMSRSGQIKGGEITRTEQDRFALQSQVRAIQAINHGYFKREIIPVSVTRRKGESLIVDTDEQPFSVKTEQGYIVATNLEKLGKLNAAFREGGTVSAGNSSTLNDGASALVMMSEEKAAELGLQPLARWVASAAAGVAPQVMGLGPIYATSKALKRAGLTLDAINLVELNEAFAVQSLAVIHELGLREEITNVNGGAIALGHPLGCSGARLMTTLLYEMRRRADAGEVMRYGLVTLCVGVGQGEATIIELLR